MHAHTRAHPPLQLVLYEGEGGCVAEDMLSVLWRDRGAHHMHMLVREQGRLEVGG